MTFYQLRTPSRFTPGSRSEKPAKRKGRPLAAYPEGSGAPLSNPQKAKLCILARAAYENRNGRAPGSEAELQEWRRGEQVKACGKASLTTCTQRDYLRLKAHFTDLTGESGEAMNLHMRHGTEDRNVAMAKLREACRIGGLTLGYPAAICRNQYKCPLEDASPHQIWRLVFTVKNRRGGKKQAAPRKPAAPKHTASDDPF